jgi:hypothetical protein
MSSPHIERLQQTSSEKSDAPSFRQRRPLPFLFFLRLCLYSGGSEPHPPPSSARNVSPQVRSACASVFPAPITMSYVRSLLSFPSRGWFCCPWVSSILGSEGRVQSLRIDFGACQGYGCWVKSISPGLRCSSRHMVSNLGGVVQNFRLFFGWVF